MLKRIKKEPINDESMDNIMYFDTDDDFYQFCVVPEIVTYEQKVPNIEEPILVATFNLSDAYNQALAKGMKFCIKDEDSQIFKHQCVSYRSITKPVENLVEYFDFPRKSGGKVHNKYSIVKYNMYIDYWDDVIRYWAKNKGAVYHSEDFWTRYSSIKLLTDLMPEPYWGNPKQCSVVILNYNPGVGVDTKKLCDIKDVNNSNKVSGLMSGKYSEYALDFPLLDTNPQGAIGHYQGAIKWWKIRNRWLSRHTQGCKFRPFALELCGWHSVNWPTSNLPVDIINSLKKTLAPVLEQSILNSEKKIGFAVGAVFGRKNGILDALGYKDITSTLTGVNKYQPLKNISRYYKVMRNTNGATIIVTWAQSSNCSPSKKFANAEAKLIKKSRVSFHNPIP